MARPESEPKTALGARLRAVRRHFGDNGGAFALRVGLIESTIAKYERGDRVPDADTLAAYRTKLNVDMNWLATGEGQMFGEDRQVQRQLSIVPFQRNEPTTLLPRYDIAASAGAGSLIVSEDVNEHFAVGRDWLRRNLPGWAPLNSTVGVLDGSGDSMEPTIRDGDTLMVVRDVEWRIVERGGIFVFSLDDRLLLKRLQVLANGDLKMISDNPAYEPYVIPVRDIPERVIIHGEVFFAGGKPRSFR